MATLFPLIVSSQIMWSLSGLEGLNCRKDGTQTDVIGHATVSFSCKDGLLDGPYKLIDTKSDLTVEEGRFRKGKLHGKTLQSSDSGPDREIEYSNGRLTGTVSIYKMVVKKFIGEKIKVKDGLRNGLSTKFYRPNQLSSERSYKAGIIDGLSKYYHSLGRNSAPVLVSTSEWRNGRLDGLTKNFDKVSGKLLSTKDYKAGRLMHPSKGKSVIEIPINPTVSALSWKRFYSNAKDTTPQLLDSVRCDRDGRTSSLISSKSEVAFFGCKNGLADGPATIVGALYSSDMFGRVRIAANFKKGKLSGTFQRYDYTGMQEDGNYNDGVRHGLWKFYFDGTLHYEFEFTLGKQGEKIRFFDEAQANNFKNWHDRVLAHQNHAEALKSVICDQPAIPWNDKLCLDLILKSTIKQARIISKVGCDQKNAKACMYLGYLTSDPNTRRFLWEDGCRYSASQCYEFIGLFSYSMRYDYMMEIANFACNNGLVKACEDRKRIEPEFIKQRELKKMALARLPEFEPFIKSVRDKNAHRPIDYKLGTEITFEQMAKIILNEKPVNKRVQVPIKKCGGLSLVEKDEFGYSVGCSADHPRVWYRIVVDRKLAESLPQKFGVGLEEPVYLTGTVIKLQATGVLDVMVIVPDSSEI
jgi:antitoxin component YwqK of YwqJK toxin-antitoxin module